MMLHAEDNTGQWMIVLHFLRIEVRAEAGTTPSLDSICTCIFVNECAGVLFMEGLGLR